jgi:hypothetical protein
MAKLSQAQIAMYAQAAGMANPALMAAIAMAESDEGDPMAHNALPPDDSYGLWQVNMIGKLGDNRRKQFGLKSNEELYNPAVNARVAASILKSQGLSAWSTYTSGAYKKYYNGSSVTQAGLKDPEDKILGLSGMDVWGNAAGAVGDGANAVGDAVEVVVKGAEWVSNPSNWLRVLYVILGGGVVIAGLALAAKDSATARQAVKMVKGLA